MTRNFYSKDISEPDIVNALNDEKYWLGETSCWPKGGLLKHRKRYNEVSLNIARLIKMLEPKTCLEVGCGLGGVVNELYKMKIDIMGMDVSKWAILHAVDDPLKLRLMVANILNFDFPDRYFDLVFSHDLLEHIPEKEIDRAIESLTRIGKRNFHILPFGGLDGDRDITHVTMHDEDWWDKRIPKEGFVLMDTYCDDIVRMRNGIITVNLLNKVSQSKQKWYAEGLM